MAQNQVVQAAWKIAEPALEGLGFELVDVEFVKDGQGWNLNVYIDKPGGIDLDDCEAANRLLDPLFDADPRIAGRHDYFSVSSPGLDRPLKTDRDFARALNSEIEVKLYAAIDKVKLFSGVLEAYDGEKIRLVNGKTSREIERKNIALARYVVHF